MNSPHRSFRAHQFLPDLRKALYASNTDLLRRILGGLLLLAAMFCEAAEAQTNQDMNAANNPLQPSLGLNLQDAYTGSYYGLDGADSNTGLLRGIIPHKLFGVPQIFRATLPLVTTPSIGPNGRTTNVGDLNIFDLALKQVGGVQLGVGPQLTIPTAASNQTGTGKWQAGLAGAVIAPKSWGLIGGLLTWQHSFAGSDRRRAQNNLLVQPFFIYNLPGQWYLRSTAAWTWDIEAKTHYIPVGVGMGKVWVDSTGVTYNFFVEPQFTVAHSGAGVPQFQVFLGLNLQFPL